MQTCGQPMHNIINYIIFSFYLRARIYFRTVGTLIDP